MDKDTLVNPSETVVDGNVKNDATVQPTVSNTQETETLRKELDQLRMRNNQLEKERQEREKKEQEAEQKRLAEKEEYKTLYERSRDELENIRKEREDAERRDKMSAVESSAFSEYSQEVQDIAKVAGLTLTSDDDTSIQEFKTKLETIKNKLPSNDKISGSNTLPENNKASREELLVRARQGDKKAFSDVVAGLSAVKAMRGEVEQ